jgi:hypothetical protein
MIIGNQKLVRGTPPYNIYDPWGEEEQRRRDRLLVRNKLIHCTHTALTLYSHCTHTALTYTQTYINIHIHKHTLYIHTNKHTTYIQMESLLYQT